MLRTKTIEIDGQKFLIGNVSRRAARAWDDAIEAHGGTGSLETAKAVDAAGDRLIASSLQRATPGFDVAQIEDLDWDDTIRLIQEITAWSRPQKEQQNPPASP